MTKPHDTKSLDTLLCDLLNTHPHDPANARYLVPLENPEEEAEAVDMAETNYNAYVDDHFTDATPKEVADACYEQFLINARRMVVDKEYMNMLEWLA